MAPVKRGRRLPTLVNRGLGLLEVILPRGGGGDAPEAPFLPPGKRDQSGFWFPAGCSKPGEIFSAQQRRLQAKQREVQKRRRPPARRRAAPPAEPGGPPERTVPLPAPLPESGGSRPRQRPSLPSSVTHPLLTAPRDTAVPPAENYRQAARVPLVVDSGKGSE